MFEWANSYIVSLSRSKPWKIQKNLMAMNGL